MDQVIPSFFSPNMLERKKELCPRVFQEELARKAKEPIIETTCARIRDSPPSKGDISLYQGQKEVKTMKALRKNSPIAGKWDLVNLLSCHYWSKMKT